MGKIVEISKLIIYGANCMHKVMHDFNCNIIQNFAKLGIRGVALVRVHDWRKITLL